MTPKSYSKNKNTSSSPTPHLHITNLPKTNRPRERLLATGPKNLTPAELLAVILGSGTSKQHVLSLSRQVVKIIRKKQQHSQINKRKSSFPHLSDLTRLHGIGKIQASKILAVLELGQRFFDQNSNNSIRPILPRLFTPKDAIGHAQSLKTSHREQLLGLYLNARYELIHQEILAVGTLNSHQLEPRDVFSPAITLPCRSLILIHNHPSGDPTPSTADILTTKKLRKAAELLGLNLLDHLIVTKNAHTSLKERGLL